MNNFLVDRRKLTIMFDIILSIFSSFSKENQVLVCAKLLSLVGVPLKTISIILHISLNSLRSILKGKKKKKRGRKTLDITEKILQIFKTDPLDYAFAYWTCGNIVKVLPSEGIKVSRETVRLKLKKQGISFRKTKGRMKSPATKRKKKCWECLGIFAKQGILFLLMSQGRL